LLELDGSKQSTEKLVDVSIMISLFCHSYNLTYFLLTYLMPLLVMGLCYLQMGRKLWREKTPPVWQKAGRLNKR
jgi:hypothetical protein